MTTRVGKDDLRGMKSGEEMSEKCLKSQWTDLTV